MTDHPDASVLIMGVGNELMGDEGFGVHVARRLSGVSLPAHVRITEGGVGGFNLLGHLEGVERLMVVDVMMVDAPPGELKFFQPGPELSEPNKQIVSFHQVGILELVRMWGLIGHQPDIWFLVTRPQNLSWDTSLSPPLQRAVEEAVELIKKWAG
jgi:hydrogenase maturation protease